MSRDRRDCVCVCVCVCVCSVINTALKQNQKKKAAKDLLLLMGVDYIYDMYGIYYIVFIIYMIHIVLYLFV
jgi:hypothetical protein